VGLNTDLFGENPRDNRLKCGSRLCKIASNGFGRYVYPEMPGVTGSLNVSECCFINFPNLMSIKVKQSRFRPGVAQRVPGS
jgi:hypothetical protein